MDLSNIVELGMSGMAIFSVTIMAIVLYRNLKPNKNGNGTKSQGVDCAIRLADCNDKREQMTNDISEIKTKVTWMAKKAGFE